MHSYGFLGFLVLSLFVEDFEDCRMLATLFKKMLLTDEQGREHLGLEEFRKLVETDEFRSYLQTRGASAVYWKWPFIVDLPIKNGDFP